MIGGKKLKAKKDQFGRSMVEMLGVLAIIGVLSVGAIAGYNTAMMKYKLNKYAQITNLLLVNAMEGTRKIGKSPSGKALYNIAIEKLGLFPDGVITKANNEEYIYETAFNSAFSIYSYPSIYGMITYVSSNTQGKEICRNLMNTAKENSSELYQIILEQVGGTRFLERFNKSGEGKPNDIATLTLADMDNYCGMCTGNIKCKFYYVWK